MHVMNTRKQKRTAMSSWCSWHLFYNVSSVLENEDQLIHVRSRVSGIERPADTEKRIGHLEGDLPEIGHRAGDSGQYTGHFQILRTLVLKVAPIHF